MVTESDAAQAEQSRKLRAKKFNEHVKLLTNALNALGLVAFGAGALQPVIQTGITAFSAGAGIWVWIGTGIALHLLAQVLIRLLRSE